MPVDDILLEAEEKMQKSESVVVDEFAGVRTGKASPALVENLPIEAYGSTMRLKELASINTPEMRSLVIQPWDTGTTGAIEKGIQAANLGLNPSVDGKLIRINLPDLTQERRGAYCRRKIGHEFSVRHLRRVHLPVAPDLFPDIGKHNHIATNFFYHLNCLIIST